MTNQTYDPFLSDDYVEPTNSDYVKLDEWTHKLRLLQSPVIVSSLWEDYTDDSGKKKRRVTRKKLASPTDLPKGEKLAWLCVAYNYKDHAVQVWEISQKKIREQITMLCKDEDFGNPLAYDLKVTRTWSWQNDTVYSIQWLGKTPVEDWIVEKLSQLTIDFDKFIAEWGSPFVTDTTDVDDVF